MHLLIDQPGHIFPDHIEFQVDFGAGDDGGNIGVFKGIWDDGDVEFCLFDVENGEAGAIEADRAFFYDQVAEFLGEFEGEFPTAVEFAAFQAGGGGVDMSLDDVAVKPAVHDQASFEVDEIAGLPGVQVGLFEGFFDGCDAMEVVFDLFHGQADAIMGNALIDF